MCRVNFLWQRGVQTPKHWQFCETNDGMKRKNKKNKNNKEKYKSKNKKSKKQGYPWGSSNSSGSRMVLQTIVTDGSLYRKRHHG